MTGPLLNACLLTVALAAAAGAHTVIHLASLQVVDLGGRAMLRLGADGPIASAPEPDATGQPVSGDRLRLRLYGVQASADLLATPAAPFVVTVTPAGVDAILDVHATGLIGGQLVLGPSPRASELVILVR